MRWLTLALLILIALLQYPLWIGKGSWLKVWDLSRQIDKQVEVNNGLKARNDGMDAEVRDLKQGFAAIEERARSELGMIKQDEEFYQVMDGGMPTPNATPVLVPKNPAAAVPAVKSVVTPVIKSPVVAPAGAMGNHKP
jgi:cell division protein FtsB